MSWADAAKRAKEHDQGSGEFLRLDDGDSVLVTFLGTPKPRDVIWDPSEHRSYDAESDRGQELEAEGERVKLRWVLKVGIGDDIKTWETSNQTFGDEVVEALNRNERSKTLFEITRKGTGKDTRYKVYRNRDLTAAECEIFAIQDKPSGDHPSQVASNGKIDQGAADVIKETLEGVDMMEQAKFLNQYDAKRFTDIPADKANAALMGARQLVEREKYLAGAK